MDTKRVNTEKNRLINNLKSKKRVDEIEYDEPTVNKMFYIRFKLMNFINSFHDSICNQVSVGFYCRAV